MLLFWYISISARKLAMSLVFSRRLKKHIGHKVMDSFYKAKYISSNNNYNFKLRKHDGECTTLDREILKLLLETHFPACSANSRQGGLSTANLDPRTWADGSNWDLAKLAITLSKTWCAMDNSSLAVSLL